MSPGLTRARAAEELSLSSGAATELVDRLDSAHLLGARPAAPTGRGRPTSVLTAHPAGPLVLVVDLRAAGWSMALGDVAGGVEQVAAGSYSEPELARVLPGLARRVRSIVGSHDGRVRAVVAAVAGTVSGFELQQFSTRGWGVTDLGVLVSGLSARSGEAQVALLVANDATLAGLAEARAGVARAHTSALHLLIAVGIGGVLVDGGRPLTGATGASGEYGHVPFGDRELRCPCGAYGCWDLAVDGRALARHLGDPEPTDPLFYALEVLARPRTPDLDRAVHAVVDAFASGIGALVTLHDPDVVTLGGLATSLRDAAPDAFATAYRRGLMAYRSAEPPPVLDSVFGAEGPLRGALVLGFDELTAPDALAAWAREHDPV